MFNFSVKIIKDNKYIILAVIVFVLVGVAFWQKWRPFKNIDLFEVDCEDQNDKCDRKRGKHVKLSNKYKIDPIIDKEHLDIENAFIKLISTINKNKNQNKMNTLIESDFQNLLIIVKKHWDTEEKLFKIGSANNNTGGHPCVDFEIQQHQLEHNKAIQAIEDLQKNYQENPNKTLQDVKELRKNIHKHILEKDVPHFKHWIKSKYTDKLNV